MVKRLMEVLIKSKLLMIRHSGTPPGINSGQNRLHGCKCLGKVRNTFPASQKNCLLDAGIHQHDIEET